MTSLAKGREHRGIVISLFDYSSNFVKPWAEAGHLCYCVDTQHPKGETVHPDYDNIILVGCDVLEWLPPRGDIVFVAAWPPCTHLAVSGARWFKGKGLGLLADSIRLFHRATQICEWSDAPYIIENPVSTISSYWRKPDYTFDPCDYGDPYTKKTCLWVGNDFIMPPRKPVEATLGSMMHKLPPSKDRANLRSETPMGFVNAVFESNVPQKGEAA